MSRRLGVALVAAACALVACDTAPSTPTAPPRTTVKPQASLRMAVRVARSDEGDDRRRVEVDVTPRGGSQAAVFTTARTVDVEVGACRPERVASLAPGQTTTIACDARITGVHPAFDVVAQIGARQQSVHVRLDAAADAARAAAADGAADRTAADGAASGDAAGATNGAPASPTREVTTPDGKRIHLVDGATPPAR